LSSSDFFAPRTIRDKGRVAGSECVRKALYICANQPSLSDQLMKKILFIVPFPKNIYPSERFRIALYEPDLHEKGYSFSTAYFWSLYARSILYQKGRFLQKTGCLLAGFLRRWCMLLTLPRYDYVFILREVAPIGPPLFEWLIARVFRKKIIYDMDDAVWIPQTAGNNAWVKSAKAFWKIKWICKWSWKVSAGNEYLQAFARAYNPRVVHTPTCVDTDNMHNRIKDQHSEKLVIGWTGSFSTLEYLSDIIPAVETLEKKYDFEFLVIADQSPMLPLKSFRYIPWREETEIEDLLRCNIGIMPLADDEYAKGKCGFKIIQFLSLGIPVAAAPVGVNAKIIVEKECGYLCRNTAEWSYALEQLLLGAERRTEMGRMGRERMEERYSRKSNAGNFLSLFE
jgi:glycosyltransferase involved in cell wall biosynthesis